MNYSIEEGVSEVSPKHSRTKYGDVYAALKKAKSGEWIALRGLSFQEAKTLRNSVYNRCRQLGIRVETRVGYEETALKGELVLYIRFAPEG